MSENPRLFSIVAVCFIANRIKLQVFFTRFVPVMRHVGVAWRGVEGIAFFEEVGGLKKDADGRIC